MACTIHGKANRSRPRSGCPSMELGREIQVCAESISLTRATIRCCPAEPGDRRVLGSECRPRASSLRGEVAGFHRAARMETIDWEGAGRAAVGSRLRSVRGALGNGANWWLPILPLPSQP